jgi:acid phosphatase type 7
MRSALAACAILLLSCTSFRAQDPLSEPGPTFRIPDNQLPNPLTFVAYGDQRFTDPSNTRSANPRIRQWLANQIASEKPAAVILNGDLPLFGDLPGDYAVVQKETEAWRDAHLRVFPALGNHELAGGDPKVGLELWWKEFPELRNRRWYSLALGSRVYVLALDSQSSLLPGSEQAKWVEAQINALSPAVDFVVITMHHPPVADIQKRLYTDHNPRPNEIALRDYLSVAAKTSHARFLVSAGHIHNYERHNLDDVVYLVAGGGGAAPYFVERTSDDLYQSILFPNFHYVKLTLSADRMRGDMYRVADPEAATLTVSIKDSFEIIAKPRK